MFSEYIAKDKVLDSFKFDFLIANETGKEWYDCSANQFMPERAWCLYQIKEGFTIVDCGAHHGMMTIIFVLATGSSGKVFAYEALPSNAAVVGRNAQLNDLSNVTVRPVGVGSEAGSFDFQHNSSNIVIASKSDESDRENKITIVRLDDDIPRGVRVDFLKVDIEGHDVEGLSGMSRIIAQRPIIDLEIHNSLFADIGESLSKIKTMLDGYSFTVLGEIFGETRALGETFNIDYIRQFDNPHVFCIPIPTSESC